MNFGSIKNGNFLKAPSSITLDGKKIYNPRDEHYLAAGYLPVVEDERNLEIKDCCPVYTIENNVIRVSWEKIEIQIREETNLSVEERIILLEQELAILKNQNTIDPNAAAISDYQNALGELGVEVNND